MDVKYVCRDCSSWLLNQDLHYLRTQDWRYPELDAVRLRVVEITEGELSGNWIDGAGEEHQDIQSDSPCENCSTTRYSYRIPILPTTVPRQILGADQERIQSWYSDLVVGEAELAAGNP